MLDISRVAMSSRRLSVVLSPLAELDFKEVLVYSIKHWGESRADQYEADILDALDDIARFPEIGSKRNALMAGMRRFVVKDYSILYQIRTRDIYVFRIVHARIDLKRLRLE